MAYSLFLPFVSSDCTACAVREKKGGGAHQCSFPDPSGGTGADGRGTVYAGCENICTESFGAGAWVGTSGTSTYMYRCTYGSDYPSGCPCLRRPPPAFAHRPAPSMATEVTEACVTSCPTDAMQCGRYVQTSPGVPQYAQVQGGAFTISKVRTTEVDEFTGARTSGSKTYWLLDKASSHWDLDGYVSADAIWGRKSDPKAIGFGGSVLGNYGCAGGCTTAGQSGAARWTTVAAIRFAGESDYTLRWRTSIRYGRNAINCNTDSTAGATPAPTRARHPPCPLRSPGWG